MLHRALRVKKLSPRFLSPFQILKRIGTFAYQIALPPPLLNLHNVFHVSQLRKYNFDPSRLLEPESVQLREDLTFDLPPMRIIDRKVKQLRSKFVPLIKVAWGKGNLEERTWELESKIRRDHPDLFSGNEF